MRAPAGRAHGYLTTRPPPLPPGASRLRAVWPRAAARATATMAPGAATCRPRLSSAPSGRGPGPRGRDRPTEAEMAEGREEAEGRQEPRTTKAEAPPPRPQRKPGRGRVPPPLARARLLGGTCLSRWQVRLSPLGGGVGGGWRRGSWGGGREVVTSL